ncbi:hypothetical protein AAT17_02870 [Nonlabens sp. MIC269]|uniref:DUF421 domain-containing protein n=1 Tax=Nonlabens sp. MIC269 TaxID=1476901 RepID=UPI0007210B95|nr:YetF domain-containing protein [Nonlabens sp. MIC269]ALM20264.1 hypothetical protein AAT17_02870 [Nonlabens sp. MIC269]
MDFIYSSDDPIWETIVSSVAIFILIIIITRIVGLRSFAKFTTYDFAITVAIGSIVSSTLTSSTSVAQGFTAIAALLILTLIVSIIQKRNSKIKSSISNQPILLMKGKEILYDNLKKAHVHEDQLIAKLREANVIHLDQVVAVVLETTGDISVLHCDDASNANLHDKILQGVKDN